MRTEQDSLGRVSIPKTEYYGVHTHRAIDNFPLLEQGLDEIFIKSFAEVKLAAAITNIQIGYLSKSIGKAICDACKQIAEGKFLNQIKVDALQGGAGTSSNMNCNEVIANIALEELGYQKGDYEKISPLHHVNLHQSTNDVYPTALKTAVLKYLAMLEKELTKLQESLQAKEKEFAGVIKAGRTQLQDAVPLTLGMEFGAYSEAISRDRWRIFKCRERIKIINLGGTAIGTGLGAPRDYIFKATENLRRITGLNLARAENLIDATQNLDQFVEISGMLKALAVNLYKISSDLRLMSSGPDTGFAEITLPSCQAGSSIMPGKVNPVIPEAISQVSIKVMSNDSLISQAVSLGQLELNQFLPLIAHAILESLKLLTNGTKIFRTRCIDGIRANAEHCKANVHNSKMIATVLLPFLGYEKTGDLLKQAEASKKSLKEILLAENIFDENKINDILSPKQMYKLGFSNEDNKL